jgi:hypothetical protein
MRTLVAGWFSFAEMGATAGDLLCRDLVCDWLGQIGCAYDVAVAPPFAGGVDWETVDPATYSNVVFVCGPLGNGWPVADFFQRFAECRLVGLSLSMLDPLDHWNPFDLLFERDSSRTSRPDISFLSDAPRVPVVGVVLIDTQPEYRDADARLPAHDAIERLIASREIAVVHIDTRLDCNSRGLRTAGEIESLISRMDVVLTTRMHGMVLALKNGVPAVVIDSVAGGAKITRQAKTIGWPCVMGVEQLTDEALREAFEYCLTPRARKKAEDCSEGARQAVEEVRRQFMAAFTPKPDLGNG